MVTRVSNPVRRPISSATTLLIPPRRWFPKASTPPSCTVIVPSSGREPSATTTIEKLVPPRCRCSMRAHTASMSNGCSGTSTMSAPPAIPEYTAIQPAWRPITSTTITRSWLSAVVCRRSIASVAICTAVWKPNVKSVAERSLSIVLGTPTARTPCSPSRDATPSVSSPPIATSASTCSRPRVASTRSTPSSTAKGLVRDVPRIVPPRCTSPRVRSIVRGTVSPSSTPRQPWRNPTIS